MTANSRWTPQLEFGCDRPVSITDLAQVNHDGFTTARDRSTPPSLLRRRQRGAALRAGGRAPPHDPAAPISGDPQPRARARRPVAPPHESRRHADRGRTGPRRAGATGARQVRPRRRRGSPGRRRRCGPADRLPAVRPDRTPAAVPRRSANDPWMWFVSVTVVCCAACAVPANISMAAAIITAAQSRRPIVNLLLVRL